MAVHERVWERPAQEAKPWQPMGTYGLLAAMAGVFLLQLVVPDGRIWLVWVDWVQRPWSPFTSTFAHGGVGHILLNGLVLFFFGPILERVLGTGRFVALFIASGALSGIVQVELSAAWGSGLPGLGASGAINFVLGTLVVLMPRQKILIYGIVPLPFWVATALFAAWDILGTFNPDNGIGNFAHLSGLVWGLALGFGLRDRGRRQATWQPHSASMR